MISGRVAGATAIERAVRIAGALAEMGVQRVDFVDANGTRRTLKTRETDLPGVLAAAGDVWNLECTQLRVTGDPNGAAWTARDAAVAMQARATLET